MTFPVCQPRGPLRRNRCATWFRALSAATQPRLSEARSWELTPGPLSQPSRARVRVPDSFQGNGPAEAERSGSSRRPARTTDAQLQTACHRRPAGKRAQTNRARGGDRLVPERRAGGRGAWKWEGGAGSGAGHGASPEAEPSRPHPRQPAGAVAPVRPRPLQGPVPVGDHPRDSVMQNGCDLQRVSVNVRVPATVRVCAQPRLWVRGRVGVWACVGVLGRVPSDM